VDLAILRISVYPLLFQKDLHSSIIIDEAIDISKEFGSDDSFKFINAVLDSIRKSQSK
jgi:N utilization substance protein B